jgi:ubiquinone/menaquinone biosynthesis C-methylase UbiE
MATKSEKINDLYSSPYLVDYYDLVAPNSDSIDDASFYWRVYQELCSPLVKAPREPFVIMDVGTGTGRVVQGLSNSAATVGDDFLNTHILGVDNAQHMLEKAAQNLDPLFKDHVSWILGSALDLESVMAKSGYSKVDLLIFSIGSISHLSQEGEPTKFLAQVSKILRPETGRAYVSIYDGSLLRKAGEIAFHQSNGVTETKSTAFPNITYRESNHRGEVQNKIKDVRFELEVVENTELGDQILETNHISMRMRQWEVDELVSLALGTGVSFVEKARGKHETFYVFQTSS